MRTDYAEHIGDKRIEARIRRRFGPEMGQLEDCGFEFHAVVSESVSGSLRFFIKVLLMQSFRRFVLDAAFPTRITFYNPLLLHRLLGCYATVLSTGVFIGSYFVDGTVLISSNALTLPEGQRSLIVPEKNYCLDTLDLSLPHVFQHHRDRLAQLKAGGHELKLSLNFEDYTHIEYRHLEVIVGWKGERK